MVLQLFISLLWLTAAATVAAWSVAKPGCVGKCGGVDIPYPFGIGNTNTSCFYNEWYEITCNVSHLNTSNPVLKKLNLEVLNIFIDNPYGTDHQILKVKSHIVSDCETGTWTSADLSGSPFNFSSQFNKFTVVGCDNIALINSGFNNEVVAGCSSICNGIRTRADGCFGINCCQTMIPDNLRMYSVNITSSKNKECKYAFLVDREFNPGNFSTSYVVKQHLEYVPVPVVLTWTIEKLPYLRDGSFSDYACESLSTNFRCRCGFVYDGNPYITDGCQVVEECRHCEKDCDVKIEGNTRMVKCMRKRTPLEIILGVSIGVGLLLFFLGSFWVYKVLKRRKENKMKKKFFKKNGGLLLQQQISSDEGIIEKTKIFTSKELEKATDNFNENRILGEGGQGTVYKGMLTNGEIVAIKRSKLVDEGQIEQFINEVVILSQINHRNIVKLLGCCLETEVPLLVYEFIQNGTLFHHIQNPIEEFPISWEMCLQIATDAAGALAYLHSASSMPIYHRDVKSTNILLDDKYRAKVSDFGISRSIAIEQSHLTTHVQGTFGYLDPEYFQSSQFTEKSDVYSFGVVLAELLTGLKPICLNRSQEERGLASHFVLSMKESRLFDILDARAMMEGRKEELIAVANLAKRCLSLNGKKRPTMKEVTMELEGIRMSHVPSTAQKSFSKSQCVISDVVEISIDASTSSELEMDYTTTSSSDSLPLFINTT